MEGGVSPLIEVDPWKDAGLARNPRVDLIVRQHHRVYLETVKVSIVITIGRWRLFLIEFFLKSFFAIYQHENGEVTCILSMSSELSQKIVDSFTFLISFNCNHNRLSGKVSLGNIWNLLYGERGWPA